MRVILTNDVPGLGDIGESVTVKPGYARNFLIPRGFAIELESRNAKAAAHKLRQIESKKRRLVSSAKEVSQRLAEVTVRFELRVGSGGKVFGSVSGKDIIGKLEAIGITIDRRRIILTEPLKKIGTHKVKVKLHPEVIVDLNVELQATAADDAQEQDETVQAKEFIEDKAAQKKKRKKGAEPAPEMPEKEEAQEDESEEEDA